MSETQEKIMNLNMTKRMLGMAEKDDKQKTGLGCAFAVSKDKKEAFLLIQPNGGGKKCAKKIKADGGSGLDGNSIRFGRVRILKTDPGIVNFTVNRSEAGGTVMTLNRYVKKAGYQGLVINVDENLENEAEEEAEAPPDPAALKARLTELVKRIPTVLATDPTRKDGLMQLAKQANIMLATNNLRTATAQIDELAAELDKPVETAGAIPEAPPPPPAPGTAGPASVATLEKTRTAWTAATKRVVADIGKLRSALEAHYGDQAAAVVAAYDRRVAPVLSAFDETLAAKLGEAISAEDGDRSKVVADCKQLIESKKAMVESDALIADLDSNPFAALAIRATMTPTLAALTTAVR